MKKIFIIDNVHEILTQGLRDSGFEVNYLPNANREDLLILINDCEGLVVRTKTAIDKDVLSNATKLKFIARAGSGLDNIDTKFCDTHGIKYFNAGEANADAVGEHALGMLLCLFANIIKADAEVRKLIWDREGNRGVELKGKTVGIIGYGNTGKAVARKLSGFEATVLVYDKYLENYSDRFATETSMDKIFAEADVITFHVPLTDETRGMVNLDYLSRFRKQIFLLNLSRGKIVNTEHLLEAMKEGKVTGCGLDVLENENFNSMNENDKRIFDSLINSSRTVITPHIAGWTSESYEKISKVLLTKIRALYF